MTRDVHGILLLDKPLGMSSAGAVARAKHLFAAAKAGHTGSLDPLAEGLLPVCFGEATKFGSHLLDADKTYEVTARLGERTASADLESPVIEKRDLAPFPAERIAAALAEFPREYLQVPPMHSAIKQDGRPLYEYARAGEVRERAPRSIVIHELTLREYRHPDLRFRVRSSKGAYIRVLAEDIALRLGTIAHLTALRRVAVAPFAPERLWTFAELERMELAARRELLLPVDAALQACRRLDLGAGGVDAFRQGQTIDIAADGPGTVRIYAAGGIFLGLGEVRETGRLVPLRLIAAPVNRA